MIMTEREKVITNHAGNGKMADSYWEGKDKPSILTVPHGEDEVRNKKQGYKGKG